MAASFLTNQMRQVKKNEQLFLFEKRIIAFPYAKVFKSSITEENDFKRGKKK